MVGGMTTAPARTSRAVEILPLGIVASAPLSGSQQAIWLMDRLAPESGAYNAHFVARMRTRLDVARLGEVVERLAERHEMLRTTCTERDGAPVQQVHARLPVPVETRVVAARSEAELRESIRAEVRRPLDLVHGPTWRVVLLEPAAPQGSQVLLLVAHHLVVDQWSMCTLVTELATLYSALAEGRAPRLPALDRQYRDYAQWHRELLEGPRGRPMLDAWAERLAGELPVLDLPLDRARPAVARMEGDTWAFRLPAGAPARVRALAHAHGTSPLAVLIATFQAVLHRFGGQREVVVGTPTTGRRGSPHWRPVVGNFINMLPIRAEVEPEQSFAALLGRVREAMEHARANEEYPLGRMVQELGLARGGSHSPVFQAMLTIQPTPPRREALAAFCVRVDEPVTLRLGDLEFEPVGVSQQEGVLDLSLELVELRGEYHAELKYAAPPLGEDTVRAMAQAYCTVLEAVLEDAERPVAALPVLSGEERSRVLAAAQGPARALGGSMVERFVEQAARTPEAIAVRDGARTLRYAELERRSARLARALRRRGVERDTVVALSMDRGLEQVVAMLGVLRAGGAYVALDRQQPAARVTAVLAQSEAVGVVVGEAAAEDLPQRLRSLEPAPWVCTLERALEAEAEDGVEVPLPAIELGDLAYVVFTSGSTGTPKGAMVEHGGMLNHLLAKVEALGLGPDDVVAQTAPSGFVIANWQVLAGLLVGATIDVVETQTARDPAALLEHVRAHEVSVVQVVPSLLRVLLDDLEARGAAASPLPSLRWIVPTGEALAPDLCRRWLSRHPEIPLLNAFGCSETSDDVAHHVIDVAPAEGALRVPIGRAVPGSSLYVLDPRGEPVADGMPGELWIGGVAVSRGYLGDPERTAERFGSRPTLPHARLYRSGDWVRRGRDGSLEYLGRADHQVKIRGVRIELGEIEQTLRRHPDLRDAAVVAPPEAEGSAIRLVAHVVARHGAAAPDEAALRAFVAARLPEAMVPAGFVLHAALPVNAHGKLDRRQLMAWASEAPAAVSAAVDEPHDELQRELVALWRDLLARAEVGVHDDFFTLGGHSLLAVRLVVRIRERFGVSLPLGTLFEHSTVARLARAIVEASEQATDGEASGAASAEPPPGAPVLRHDAARAHEPFALTDLQQAYWLGQSDGLSFGGLAAVAYLEREVEPLDLARLQVALDRVIARHAMLRMVVHDDGRQRILAEVPRFPLEVVDLRGRPAAEVEARAAQVREAVRRRGPEPGRWPILQLVVHRHDEGDRLHLGFPLLLGDLQSARVLFAELDALYRDPEAALEPVRAHFRDYVELQAALRSSPPHQRAARYWQDRLGSLPGAPALPRASRTASASASFRRLRAVLPHADWARLEQRAQRAGLTATGVVAAAYAEVVARFSESRHFCLTLLHQSRMPVHPQIDQVIGNFSSTVLLEVDYREPSSLRERARALQAQLWRDLEHGQVGGVEVLRQLAQARGTGTSTSYPVVLASTLHLGADEVEGPGDALLGTLVSDHLQTPHVWIDHQVQRSHAGLAYHWDMRDGVLPEGVAEAMFASYGALLAALAEGRGWERIEPLELPASQLEARARANATDDAVVEGTLPERFFARAAAHPERVAVIDGRRTLRYGELRDRVVALARRLRARGEGPGRVVAVAMAKGWEQVVAVLAVQAAGAAYLPLDPALPRARREALVARAAARVVLTSRASSEAEAEAHAWSPELETLVVDDAPVAAPGLALDGPSAEPSALAYVIFTSGSTGTPKGVMIDHRGALNTVLDINERLGLGPDDRALALSSLSFDLSVYDVFGPLSVGGAVVMPDAARLREPAHWAALLREHGVTVWSSVPQLMQLLVDHEEQLHGASLAGLRAALLSGDWIPVGLPDRLRARAPGCRVLGLGGATEASIWSIAHAVEAVDPRWSSIPYGTPLKNQRFHVLGPRLEPQPTWVSGELYIAGVGLALGYLGDPEQTAARFVTHPNTGERLYRTGDLGRYLPDGSIELLGRVDFQVKIGGFRVELGEIEAQLDALPEVGGCVVVAHGPRRGAQRLVAYVVPAAGQPVDVDALRARLGESLPAYMVPSQVMVLERLPLTGNGKLDRRALPSPDEGPERTGEAQHREPRSALERRLVALWREVLEVDAIGVHDDFFTALGGHSFAAVRLLARVQAQLGVALPLASLLEGPTIAAQARCLEASAQGATPWSPVVTLQEGRADGLTPLWLVHPVGGHVLCYRALVAGLDPRRPVHGLEARGFAEGAVPLSSVPAMASLYLEALRTVQPQGPYLLGGWSMGGLVAQEMARQLEAAGESVAGLLLIDGAPPEPGPALGEVERLAWFMRDLVAAGDRPFEVDRAQLEADAPTLAGGRVAAALAQARRAGVVGADLELPELERLHRVFVAHDDAMQAHRPGVVRAPTLLLDALEGRGQAPGTAWAPWVGAWQRRVLLGDHYTLLRTHVATLAQHVERGLLALEPAVALDRAG